LGRKLSQIEHKKGWKWSTRDYRIEVGEKVAYLYNQEGKLLTACNYSCVLDDLNMFDFTANCIYILTQRDINKIKIEYQRKYRVKQELWKIYRIPVEISIPHRRISRWIRIRKEVNIKLTIKPNALGYYYAEITTVFPAPTIKLINNNIFELLYDLFFAIECYVGKENMPHTFSQSWYDDYDVYNDRHYPDSVARYNVEQAHYEYAFKELMKVFKDSTKTTFIHIIQLFRKLNKENKYYIMDTIINDPHFRIDENEYVIYEPTIGGELDIIEREEM